jgi:hypothetical protein
LANFLVSRSELWSLPIAHSRSLSALFKRSSGSKARIFRNLDYNV